MKSKKRSNHLPHIELNQGMPTFMVRGEPFIMLAGEIHNSSASNPQYMEEEVWPYVRGMNINTLIVPVYWELVEEW